MRSSLLKNVFQSAADVAKAEQKKPLLRRAAAKVLSPLKRVVSLLPGRRAGGVHLAAMPDRDKASAVLAVAIQPFDLQPHMMQPKDCHPMGTPERHEVQREENEGGLVVDDDFEPIAPYGLDNAHTFAGFGAIADTEERSPKAHQGVTSAHASVEWGNEARQRFASTARKGAAPAVTHRRDGI